MGFKDNIRRKENISIIGFMGSGKSTAGKILAKKIGFLYIDIDTVIELSEGMKISRIFEEKGESYFRKVESEVIYKIYNNTGCVFSCGGGVILNEKNMDMIKKSSIVVFLSVNAETVFERLKDEENRPLLARGDREKIIKDMLDFRQPLYLKYSDIAIDANSITPNEAAKKIIGEIKLKINS
ncbi:MAG: shikimate kinase [Actinobacteria bacterium]|nr:shikimate kinase [Actinomycetota bacterium]